MTILFLNKDNCVRLCKRMSLKRIEIVSLDDCDSPRICNTAYPKNSQYTFAGSMNEATSASYLVTSVPII